METDGTIWHVCMFVCMFLYWLPTSREKICGDQHLCPFSARGLTRNEVVHFAAQAASTTTRTTKIIGAKLREQENRDISSSKKHARYAPILHPRLSFIPLIGPFACTAQQADQMKKMRARNRSDKQTLKRLAASERPDCACVDQHSPTHTHKLSRSLPNSPTSPCR